MFAASHQDTYAGLALGCALLATVTDIRERRIPNALTGAAAIMGLLVHAAWDGWGGIGSSMEAGLLSGALFLVLHLAGGMGAGDVKLMAAIGFLNGLARLEWILLCTVLSGGFLAAAILARNVSLRQLTVRASVWVHAGASCNFKKADKAVLAGGSLSIPYAVPIAAGCLLNFVGQIR